MRAVARGGAGGGGRSPAAGGTTNAVCRMTALRHTTWLERGQSRGIDEANRRQSVGRRHHRDFLISRLAASAVTITPPAQDAACSLSPLAIRAFTPVFHGPWRRSG